jgi:RNA polymerase sigma factor (sigma-70 family)
MASARVDEGLVHIRRLFSVGTVAGLSDAELLGRFLAQRDEAAFAALVDRHGGMVMGLCRSRLRDATLAEDAFQATFLILARKARTIRGSEGLGGWLWRVASRVATQARADERRRKDEERRAGEQRSRQATDQGPARDELYVALHEELARLAERHRRPVVLCDLEGRTRAAAAAELRWSEATLGRRLAEARERLRSRLVRRGFAPAATAAVAALASETARALPPDCVETTTRRALSGAKSSTAVIALADGYLRSLFFIKLELAIAAGLAAAVVSSLLIAGLGERPAPRQAPQAQSALPAAVPEKPTESAELVFQGRVLDPDGRPRAGARVYLFPEPFPRAVVTPTLRATTDAKGRFRLALNAVQAERVRALRYRLGDVDGLGMLLAMADGVGPAWTAVPLKTANEITLTLARDDVPVEARLLDPQGRPAAGITVRPAAIKATASGDLTDFLAAAAAENDVWNGAEARFFSTWMPNTFRFFPPVVTDAQGRFRMTGIGRERILAVFLEGPGIATAQIQIATRGKGVILSRPPHKAFPDLGTATYVGARFEYELAPGRTVEGVVRDRKTQRPVTNAIVRQDITIGNPAEHLEAVTDTNGRFKLAGLWQDRPIGLHALPPKSDSLLPSFAAVAPGRGPVPVQFELARGVHVQGRLIDRATGRPAQGTILYFAFMNNPHLNDVSEFARGTLGDSTPTGEDGAFQLVALPGPGLIAALVAKDRDSFLRGAGSQSIAGRRDSGPFHTMPMPCSPDDYHTLAALNPAEGTDSMTRDLFVETGTSREGTIQDQDGRPVSGTVADGLGSMERRETLATPKFTAAGLAPDKPRRIVVRHEGRRLIGSVMATADDATPLTLTLKPWATLSGRLVDAQGAPRGGVELVPWQASLRLSSGLLSDRIPVGPDGRFRIEGLLPDAKYDFAVMEKGALVSGLAVKGVAVASGVSKDVGDVRVTPPE